MNLIGKTATSLNCESQNFEKYDTYRISQTNAHINSTNSCATAPIGIYQNLLFEMNAQRNHFQYATSIAEQKKELTTTHVR